MGTWGTGPFDSDLAADFVDELGGTHPPSRQLTCCGGDSGESPTRVNAWVTETGPKSWAQTLSSPAPSRAAPS
ncbi:DUF4259 domain-containing protein [Streptomyces niveus]|uniref:DUF4259 domain-containing protein n=1 Tax=Streptomyces niveus TaxID=193462 RepID=UPI0036DB69FD